MSIKGNNLAGLVRVEGYPQFENEEGKQSLKDQFVCQWSLWQSLIPPIGSQTDQIANFVLTSQSVERIGEAARISLTYNKQSIGGSGTEPSIDGDDVYESRASITTDEEGERLPSITWIRKKRVSSFALTEANITLNVNRRVDPPGITEPTSGSWLKISREITITDDYTEITDSYDYRLVTWPQDDAIVPED